MNVSLDSSQLTELKQRLLQARQSLREDIRDELLRTENEHYIELAGRVHDEGDQSVADLLADINTTIIDKQLGAVREIEDALARIRIGVYGVCVDCGETIVVDRLRAQPSAARCLSCQAALERSRMRREPSL